MTRLLVSAINSRRAGNWLLFAAFLVFCGSASAQSLPRMQDALAADLISACNREAAVLVRSLRSERPGRTQIQAIDEVLGRVTATAAEQDVSNMRRALESAQSLLTTRTMSPSEGVHGALFALCISQRRLLQLGGLVRFHTSDACLKAEAIHFSNMQFNNNCRAPVIAVWCVPQTDCTTTSLTLMMKPGDSFTVRGVKAESVSAIQTAGCRIDQKPVLDPPGFKVECLSRQ